MAMNRQTKRMLQRQGQLREDGTPAARPAPRPAAKPPQQRTSAGQYVREVRGELRKVAWPTREEVINYSVIVFVSLVVLTALIFGMDNAFSRAVLYIFNT